MSIIVSTWEATDDCRIKIRALYKVNPHAVLVHHTLVLSLSVAFGTLSMKCPIYFYSRVLYGSPATLVPGLLGAIHMNWQSKYKREAGGGGVKEGLSQA